MKLSLSKKAVAFNILNYSIWRIMFITLLFYAMYSLASSQVNSTIDVSDIRSQIMSQRIINALSYTSPHTLRTYSGIIPNEKIQGESPFQFDENSDLFSAEITLENTQTGLQHDLYINKKWFDRYYDLKKFDQYRASLEWRSALIRENAQKIDKARMIIKTVEHEDT